MITVVLKDEEIKKKTSVVALIISGLNVVTLERRKKRRNK